MARTIPTQPSAPSRESKLATFRAYFGRDPDSNDEVILDDVVDVLTLIEARREVRH